MSEPVLTAQKREFSVVEKVQFDLLNGLRTARARPKIDRMDDTDIFSTADAAEATGADYGDLLDYAREAGLPRIGTAFAWTQADVDAYLDACDVDDDDEDEDDQDVDLDDEYDEEEYDDDDDDDDE